MWSGSSEWKNFNCKGWWVVELPPCLFSNKLHNNEHEVTNSSFLTAKCVKCLWRNVCLTYDWPTEILNQFKEGKTKSWYDFSTYGPAVELPEFSPLLELILFSVASVEKKKTGASCELFLDLKIEF